MSSRAGGCCYASGHEEAPAGPLVLTPPSPGAPLSGIFKTDDPIFLQVTQFQLNANYVFAVDPQDRAVKAYHLTIEGAAFGGRTQIVSGDTIGSGLQCPGLLIH